MVDVKQPETDPEIVGEGILRLIEEQVKFHEELGLVEKMISAGLVKDRDEYKEQFVQLASGNPELGENIGKERGLPVLVPPIQPGKFSVGDLWRALSLGSEEDAKAFDALRRVDVSRIRNLYILDQLLESVIIKEIRYALEKEEPGFPPRILFIPDLLEADGTGKEPRSAVEELHLMDDVKAKFLDPAADMMRLAAQRKRGLDAIGRIIQEANKEFGAMGVDAWLRENFGERIGIVGSHLPDVSRATRYPGFFTPDGRIGGVETKVAFPDRMRFRASPLVGHTDNFSGRRV